MGFDNENISLTLPAPSILANDMGGVFPVPAIALTAVMGADVNLDVSGISITAELISGTAGGVDALIPAVTLDSQLSVGEVASLNKALPAVTLIAQMASGGLASVDKMLPAVKIEISMTRDSVARLTVPAITIQASMSEVINWSANLRVPAVTLDAKMQVLILYPATDASADVEVWVINAETGKVSQYASWPVNSHGLFDGREIIALADGLYEISKTDDDGVNIDAKVMWAPTNCGTSQQKRLAPAFVNYRHDGGSYNLITIADETEKRIYSFNNNGRKQGADVKRIKLNKGQKAKLWQIGFENQGGADFDLENILIPTIPSKRKSR